MRLTASNEADSLVLDQELFTLYTYFKKYGICHHSQVPDLEYGEMVDEGADGV